MRRVSLPICIGSAVLVVLLTWWLSTRSRDFMTPPRDSELAEIRLAAAQTNPTAQGLGDALSPANAQENDTTPIPVILPESLTFAPSIEDYRNEAKHGADYLIELAGLLEAANQSERALSCWERVIDSCKATPRQSNLAMRAIIRIKADLYEADLPSPVPIELPVVIQSGTGTTAAKALEPVLTAVADELERVALGTIEVKTKISTGTEDMIDDGKSPVALWISGPDEDSKSTDVISLFISLDHPEGLKKQLQRELYRIIRHQLGQMDDFQPLPKPHDQNSPDKLLEGRISRMVWIYFANSLQNTP